MTEPAPMSEDFYQILGVSPQAEAAEIKKAYRTMARTYHPDRNPGNEEAADKFKDAAEAYRVLGDVDLRAQYDAYRNGTGTDEEPEDLFGDIFGTRPVGRERRKPPRQQAPQKRAQRRGPSRYKERGEDLVYRLELDFFDAAAGTTKEINIPRKVRCIACGGTGADRSSAPIVCPDCHGSGSIRVQEGFFDRTERCPRCGGSGRIVSSACPVCEGSGVVEEMQPFLVEVPSGVSAGTRLRFAGEGQPGQAGGENGDLIVEIQIHPDSMFERDGDDLLVEVPVPFITAALGGPVDIPTLDGKMRMRIPAGSQSGRVFRLKAKGLPGRQGRGDQRVRIVVEVPESLSDRQRRLLQAFADATESDGDGSPRVAEFSRELERRYGSDI